ncbi:MAG: metallophosphoesterase family protein [Limnospira sp. PMC 1291.21]|uniref:metallophosphoesterase family protein n=1 Tax=unclassified Limnospira TaxID=2642885 RepID=UPI0028E0F8BF|nr:MULTISPECIES: metallophosphoesterase family protein [unclassified Limnospira]MDT9178886.1 metallophosphoesterase family protein [Limnospira sp. PMC 1238.20]MDT9191877.1 metallophosphoesterase family protein [Limnospira sp. PMC 1245.20]MDT9202157.1 metallophosphoesterase family protein [Limnospira sp. PMC 1243.20]MDT9209490.1 metallophosphoesterase family protein [Limnospira sp. PMC 1252.20]MDT9214679.1 metallophosphoesterase family protein [Limnospira sp. PMC 1256.20]
MSKRRIVIGDIHGHYKGMMALLDKVAPNSDDEVYFLGDLIDRGPKSAQVVEFVKNSPYKCLMGNHEQLMLEALPEVGRNQQAWQAWLYSGGQTTVASYQEAEIIPRDHLHWMRSLPLFLDLGDTWLVHAGVNPRRPIEQQTPSDFCWIRKEFHSIPKPYFDKKQIIIGHTITFTFDGVEPGNLVQGQGWLGIDTGVYHAKSGWLTALELDTNTVYQVNALHSKFRVLPLEEIVTTLKRPSIFDRLRYVRPQAH